MASGKLLRKLINSGIRGDTEDFRAASEAVIREERQRKRMNAEQLSKARNPLLPAALVAIKRAAKRARQEALRTHTRIIVLRSGSIEHIEVNEVRESETEYNASPALPDSEADA